MTTHFWQLCPSQRQWANRELLAGQQMKHPNGEKETTVREMVQEEGRTGAACDASLENAVELNDPGTF